MTIDFEAQHTKYSLSHPADSLLAIGRGSLRTALVIESPFNYQFSILNFQLPSCLYGVDRCDDCPSYPETRECCGTMFSDGIVAWYRCLLVAVGAFPYSPDMGLSILSELIQPAGLLRNAHRDSYHCYLGSCTLSILNCQLPILNPFQPLCVASHRGCLSCLARFYHCSPNSSRTIKQE